MKHRDVPFKYEGFTSLNEIAVERGVDYTTVHRKAISLGLTTHRLWTRIPRMGGTSSQTRKIRYLTDADAEKLRAQYVYGADRYVPDLDRALKKLVNQVKDLIGKGVILYGTAQEIKIKLQVTWKTALEIENNLNGSMSHE